MRIESDPAPIIVTALMAPQDFAWANTLRQRHFPPERNVLDAHVTLFHHLPPSSGRPKSKLDCMTRLVRRIARRPMRDAERGVVNLGRWRCLSGWRVRSCWRCARNWPIRFSRAADPTGPARRPRLHITVQNKVKAGEVKARGLAELSLNANFVASAACRSAGLGSFYYRGGPWEPIGRHMFRGR